MFAGPIIAREILTTPRPVRYYAARASSAALQFILMWTAWQALVGWREVREIGVLSRFGAILFLFFIVMQLTLMLFFAPLASATAVAFEKDRRTFVLLLMTDLRNVEIVLGKLAASLLQIVTLLATGAPVFFLCLLLGGVSAGQVIDVLAVTFASGLVGGSLGLVVALWRERTLQSLALTVLLVVLALGGVEAAGFVRPNATLLGLPLSTALNPYRTLVAIFYPDYGPTGVLGRPSLVFIVASLAIAAALNAFSIRMLRVWNPGRDAHREEREDAGELVETLIELPEPAVASVGEGTGLRVPRRTHRRVSKPAEKHRVPWSNPIIWRELKTRAYGNKPLILKAAYLLAFLLGVAFFLSRPDTIADPWRPAKVLVPLAILSLVLINAQGVTALTSERDTGALDLLLVTELTPKEFIYGKLYGVLYNCWDRILLPVALTVWFAFDGRIGIESSVFAIVDFLLLCHFSAMLGLHSAISHTNSRAAIANSLGTIFFLMVGILVCAFLIILSDRQFSRQLLSFMIFIGAGSVALFGSLGARNPSQAIAAVAILTPFWSFYCVISLLNGDSAAAFFFSMGVYGFALLAMLVPAVSDFDIALGRTNAIQG